MYYNISLFYFYRMLKFSIKRRAQRIIHTHTLFYIYQEYLKNIFKIVFTLSFQKIAGTVDRSLLDCRQEAQELSTDSMQGTVDRIFLKVGFSKLSR